MRSRPALVLLAVASTLVACGGGGATVPVSAGDDGKAVVGTVGDVFSLRLGENPSTGYAWKITQEPDAAVVELDNTTYTPGETGMLGAEGTREWTFDAVGAGRTELKMDYVGPGDGEVGNSYSVIFQVE